MLKHLCPNLISITRPKDSRGDGASTRDGAHCAHHSDFQAVSCFCDRGCGFYGFLLFFFSCRFLATSFLDSGKRKQCDA